MISDDYEKKINRMKMIENERKQRIFNDKQRLIGVDKLALDNQIKEKRQCEQRTHMYEEVQQKNLILFSEQALQEEQFVKHLAYKDSEYQRQIHNKLLAHEQKLQHNRMNHDALSNIPTDDYYNYFNTSSR